MGNDLKTLLEALVREGDADIAGVALTDTEVIVSDTEEAWNDFQDSQVAFEKAFKNSEQGPL